MADYELCNEKNEQGKIESESPVKIYCANVNRNAIPPFVLEVLY